MAAPLRIRLPQESLAAGPEEPQEKAKTYLGELVKLIPAEIVALYIFGRGLISAQFGMPTPAALLPEWAYWIGWFLLCLILLVLVRCWLTSDSETTLGPEWPAVWLAVSAFVVWVYSMGDVFDRVLRIWDPLLASLLVPAHTIAGPAIYRGLARKS
ncbi:MAG: hypothetical protein JOY71_19095 [Acetobacteraceae bacterium]|nr:hypothetical protein [Acetobacteraceae bacterium]MBV8524201.1 hypothetical protein [Acetobacteraceae bacterium]MBV8588822.1 hypothetical protein [Acetobacteraceae bacterium]